LALPRYFFNLLVTTRNDYARREVWKCVNNELASMLFSRCFEVLNNFRRARAAERRFPFNAAQSGEYCLTHAPSLRAIYEEINMTQVGKAIPPELKHALRVTVGRQDARSSAAKAAPPALTEMREPMHQCFALHARLRRAIRKE
jgi:hypothetical protein